MLQPITHFAAWTLFCLSGFLWPNIASAAEPTQEPKIQVEVDDLSSDPNFGPASLGMADLLLTALANHAELPEGKLVLQVNQVFPSIELRAKLSHGGELLSQDFSGDADFFLKPLRSVLAWVLAGGKERRAGNAEQDAQELTFPGATEDLDAILHYSLALRAHQLKRWGRAKARFRRALREDPNFGRAQERLAQVEEELKEQIADRQGIQRDETGPLLDRIDSLEGRTSGLSSLEASISRFIAAVGLNESPRDHFLIARRVVLAGLPEGLSIYANEKTLALDEWALGTWARAAELLRDYQTMKTVGGAFLAQYPSSPWAAALKGSIRRQNEQAEAEAKGKAAVADLQVKAVLGPLESRCRKDPRLERRASSCKAWFETAADAEQDLHKDLLSLWGEAARDLGGRSVLESALAAAEASKDPRSIRRIGGFLKVLEKAEAKAKAAKEQLAAQEQPSVSALVRASTSLAAAGHWEEAKALLDAGLLEEPQQGRLHDLRVRLALQQGNAESARAALESWGGSLAPDEEVNPVRIQAYEELIRELRQPDRAEGQAAIELAGSLQAASQWKAAADAFVSFAKEFKELGDPVYTPAYALLQAASCLRALGQNGDARELYDEIILYWTTSPEAQTAQAALSSLPEN